VKANDPWRWGEYPGDMKRLLIGLTILGSLTAACAGAATQTGTFPSLSSSANANVNRAVAPTATLPSVNPNANPVVRVVQRVLPSVVNVTTNLLEQSPTGGSQPGRGVGTGSIIGSNGIVVTNFHVVEGAQHITVTTSTKPIKSYTARVIGGDQTADLAVLKINATGLPTVQLGNSNSLVLGQPVVALGYALALSGGPTVTSGIVSALGRTVTASDPNLASGSRTYSNVIQTDAAINPGNSGGPLVNMQGQVVGINTAGIAQAENIGFAIAINSAKGTIADAEAHPAAPVAYLGVTTTTVTDLLRMQEGLPVSRGAFVIDVGPQGPAQKAGIRAGDVITAFDGQAVNDSDDLGNLIQQKSPGDSVSVTVADPRGGTRTVTVHLGVRPLPTPAP